jgi:murein DD-endopeptidase MepM/ murein hydrolase activator NlpD
MDYKATQNIPDPGPPAPLWQRTWVKILGVLLGIGLFWSFGWIGTGDYRGPAGSIQSWTSAEAKEALKEYLEAQVQLPDLKLKVVRVEKGDNYWNLARQAGLSIDGLVGYNLDMQHLNAYIGRVLLIGNKAGTLHQVLEGETIASLEEDYGLEAGALRQANRIGRRGPQVGQVLFLPNAKPRQFTPEMAELYEGREFFRSPLAGVYTSLLGGRVDPFTGDYRVHNGVDIKAPFNALVAAAADGRVVEAGWKGGYGKSVVINHKDGYRTLYGHMNVILVKAGQDVKQHQYIGKVGMTGRTTGAHLHFTIWRNGKLRDPLKYLW